jgi:hypothetical protein
MILLGFILDLKTNLLIIKYVNKKFKFKVYSWPKIDLLIIKLYEALNIKPNYISMKHN